MSGELGTKLVQHAKRILSLNYLPPYQTEIIQSLAREVRDLDRDIALILERLEREREQDVGGIGGSSSFNPSEDPATACALLVDHLYMRRNKRCLLAYHRVRAEKLEEMCWNGIDPFEQGGRLQSANADAGAADDENGDENENENENENTGNNSNNSNSYSNNSLSPIEEEYFRQYNEMLVAYKGGFTDIDLTGSLEPPKELYIDVRVLKDVGEIQTEYGYVFLDSRFVFFRSPRFPRSMFEVLSYLQAALSILNLLTRPFFFPFFLN